MYFLNFFKQGNFKEHFKFFNSGDNSDELVYPYTLTDTAQLKLLLVTIYRVFQYKGETLIKLISDSDATQGRFSCDCSCSLRPGAVKLLFSW